MPCLKMRAQAIKSGELLHWLSAY